MYSFSESCTGSGTRRRCWCSPPHSSTPSPPPTSPGSTSGPSDILGQYTFLIYTYVQCTLYIFVMKMHTIEEWETLRYGKIVSPLFNEQDMSISSLNNLHIEYFKLIYAFNFKCFVLRYNGKLLMMNLPKESGMDKLYIVHTSYHYAIKSSNTLYLQEQM